MSGGAESRSTLSDESELAAVIEQQGRAAEAEALDRALMESSGRAYPAGHPFPLMARANLAQGLILDHRNEEVIPVLERALELFERGMKLSDACRKQLEEAETRVEVLMKRAGEVQPEPLRSNKA